jgi:arylsulfatase A-like enzyme
MRIPLSCLFAIALAVANSLAADVQNKPNVLFIAVDDLRPELGCYGGAAKSPNLDELAKRSVLFDRAYCQQAVCSPSRTSMLTGRRPDTTKIYDLETHFRTTIPDVVTLPQYFKANGYHTQSFGKIYHGGLNDPKSWSVPHTENRANQYADPKILAAIRAKGAQGDEQGGKNKGPAWEIADCADNELPDGWIADHAIEALRQVKDKPFFLAVGFLKPHLPFVAPRRFFDLYPPESIALSPNPEHAKDAPAMAFTDFGELRAYMNIPKKGPVSDQQAKELRRAYYAATSFMDSQAGRVLAELDRLRLRESTIVVLWGDHGWHLGDEGMWTKHTNFEIATRAAFMLSVPGMKHAGEKTAALVEYVDIYPTLCDLAGLQRPDGLEGTSFAPLLEDPSRPWKKAAFSQYPRGAKSMGYTMRTDRYRYTEWVTRDAKREVLARELYDHQADPLETANVAEKQPQVAKELAEQLAKGWRGAQP